MKSELYQTIKHTLGEWPVQIVSDMNEADEAAWLAEFESLKLAGWMVETSWRTPGLAVGYLKRVAKHLPDSGSRFVLVPWAGKYKIYFSSEDQ